MLSERIRTWSRVPWAAALLWILYAIIAVPGWGLLSGRPLGPLGTTVLLAIFWGWIFPRRVPFAPLVAGALVLKLLVGGLLLDRGFRAFYYANDEWRPPYERSLDFLTLSATRIDERLTFRERTAPFPLYFFNDLSRFNYFLPNDPDRYRLPFSVAWEGWLHVPDERTERFYVEFPAPSLNDLPTRWTRDYTGDYLFWRDWFAPEVDADDPGLQELYSRATGLGGRKGDRLNKGRDVSGTRVLRSWPSLPDAPAPPLKAALRVDAQALVSLDGGSTRQEADVTLRPGWHRVVVLYAAPQDIPRRFAAGIVQDGRDHVLDSTVVYTGPAPAWRLAIDRAVRAASLLQDALLIAVLAGWLATKLGGSLGRLWRTLRSGQLVGRDALTVASALVIAYVVLRAAPLANLPVSLTGGDDWLTYETHARDIGLHGPLMLGGAPLGHGRPFYYQPFYSYFLAVLHLLTGEDLWGIYVAQQLLLAGMVWALGRLTAELFGKVAGWLALALGWYFAYHVIRLNVPPHQVGGSLLGESFFLPLLTFWMLGLARLAAAPRPAAGRAAWVGAMGGIAALTRVPLVLALPPATALLGWSLWRRWRSAAVTPLAVFAACLVATIGLATVRNAVVSGHWVLITASGPDILMISNRPPPDVDVSRAQTRPLYASFGLHPKVRTVVEYAIQAPASFARGLVGKASYTLGLSESGREPRALMLIWASALLGLGMALQPGLSGPERFAPALVALCHFAVMVIVGVFAYGYRLTYPMYLTLLPYSALALAMIGGRLSRAREQQGP